MRRSVLRAVTLLGLCATSAAFAAGGRGSTPDSSISPAQRALESRIRKAADFFMQRRPSPAIPSSDHRIEKGLHYATEAGAALEWRADGEKATKLVTKAEHIETKVLAADGK